MSKSITDLLYGKGHTAFYNAVKARQVYESRPLKHKLEQALFFFKLEAEVSPSYNFGSKVEQTFINLPEFLTEDTLERESEAFVASELDYLRVRLQEVLLCFKQFPQVFIDLYRFYPKFNLKFEELEFVYLDFGSQTPKVIDSLRVELKVRGDLLSEPFAAVGWARGEEVLPPWKEKDGSPEELLAMMRSYFLRHARDPVFVEILNLYLKARPKILEECTKGLCEVIPESPELPEEVLKDALAQYFIMYYVFKDVTLETLRFCVANAQFFQAPGTQTFFQDPFIPQRQQAILTWEAFTEEARQEYIKGKQHVLEEGTLRLAREAAKTHEEKLAEFAAREAEFEKKRPAGEAAFAYVKALNDESRNQ